MKNKSVSMERQKARDFFNGLDKDKKNQLFDDVILFGRIDWKDYGLSFCPSDEFWDEVDNLLDGNRYSKYE